MIRRLTGHAGSVRMLRPGINAAGAPPLAARGRFQRENLALALVACEVFLGEAFDRARAIAAAARVVVPGRLQTIGSEPLVLVDGAHNPHGARALAAELPAAVGDRRPLVGVIAILADKDVDGVLDELAPCLQAAVATQSASPRALAAADLAARIAARGVPAEVCTPPSAALARARDAGRSGGRRAGRRVAVAARGTGAVAGPGCGGGVEWPGRQAGSAWSRSPLRSSSRLFCSRTPSGTLSAGSCCEGSK